MKFGNARIPYKLTAYSKTNEEKCIEEGFLTVHKAWDAKSTITTGFYKLCIWFSLNCFPSAKILCSLMHE